MPRVRNERQGTLWGANRHAASGVTYCGVVNTGNRHDTCGGSQGGNKRSGFCRSYLTSEPPKYVRQETGTSRSNTGSSTSCFLRKHQSFLSLLSSAAYGGSNPRAGMSGRSVRSCGYRRKERKQHSSHVAQNSFLVCLRVQATETESLGSFDEL